MFKSFKKAAVERVSSASDELDYKYVMKGFSTVSPHGSTATGGHCMLWRCLPAVDDKTRERITLHLLNRKDLDDTLGKQTAQEVIDRIKLGVSQQARIVHPGTLRIKSALRERGNYLLYATEPILFSLANALHETPNIDHASPEMRSYLTDLSAVEREYGLYQIVESLTFLHTQVGVAHLNLHPATIWVSLEGDWKCGNFDFAVHNDSKEGVCQNFKKFVGDDAFSSAINPYLVPNLGTSAPEFVRDLMPSVASDSFSFGCLMHEVLSFDANAVQRRPLVNCQSDVSVYNSQVANLKMKMFEEVGIAASEVVRTLTGEGPPRTSTSLGQMLSASQMFSNLAIKCLVYMSRLPEKTEQAKIAFLRDLYSVVSEQKYCAKVIKSRILPVLTPQLTQMKVQYVLPIVLLTVETLDGADFQNILYPVLESYLKACSVTSSPTHLLPDAQAKNTVSALLLEKLDGITKKCRPEAVRSVIVPFVCQNLETNATTALFDVITQLCEADVVEPDTLNSKLVPRVCHVARSHPEASIRHKGLEVLASLKPKTTSQCFSEKVFPLLLTILQSETSTANLSALKDYFVQGDAKLFSTAAIADEMLPQMTGLLRVEGAQNALEDTRFSILHDVYLHLVQRVKTNRVEKREAFSQKAKPAAAPAAAAPQQTSEWQSDLPLTKSTSDASFGSTMPSSQCDPYKTSPATPSGMPNTTQPAAPPATFPPMTQQPAPTPFQQGNDPFAALGASGLGGSGFASPVKIQQQGPSNTVNANSNVNPPAPFGSVGGVGSGGAKGMDFAAFGVGPGSVSNVPTTANIPAPAQSNIIKNHQPSIDDLFS